MAKGLTNFLKRIFTSKPRKKPFTIVLRSGEKHVFTHKPRLRRRLKRWLTDFLAAAALATLAYPSQAAVPNVEGVAHQVVRSSVTAFQGGAWTLSTNTVVTPTISSIAVYNVAGTSLSVTGPNNAALALDSTVVALTTRTPNFIGTEVRRFATLTSGSLSCTGRCTGYCVSPQVTDGSYYTVSGDTMTARVGFPICEGLYGNTTNQTVYWVSGTLDVMIQCVSP